MFLKGIWEVGDKVIVANSWLHQFWKVLYAQSVAVRMTFKLKNGSDYTCGNDPYNLRCTADINDPDFGLAIGASNQPVDIINDYKLVSEYSTTDFFYSSCAVSDGGTYLEVYRSFQNISGVSKDIYELGLYCRVYNSGVGVCVERTVLDTPITVAPDEEVPIRFKIYYAGGM